MIARSLWRPLPAVLLCAAFAAAPAFGQATRMTPEERKAQTQADYEAMTEAYLSSDWDTVKEKVDALRVAYRMLGREEQAIFRDVRLDYVKYKPDWWENTSSPSNTTFKAEIWDRKFTANYMPSGALGYQAVRAEGRHRRQRDGSYKLEITSLQIIVTWKPNLVDSPKPAAGALSRKMGYTLGDIAEIIIWHELGHNFITGRLPLKAIAELYTEHEILYTHLQEFFADLTSLYHSSPKARRAVLQLRLEGMDHYNESSAHTRGAHGIGALILADVLTNRDKWPSVRLPPAVPDEQPELNTIIYMYEKWNPDWTMAEANRLRKLAGDFVKQKGDRAFKAKGEFPIGNGTSYSLMIAQDRKHQQKRDQWVSDQLTRLISEGKTDKLAAGEEYKPRLGTDEQGRSVIRTHKNEDEVHPRIVIPW